MKCLPSSGERLARAPCVIATLAFLSAAGGQALAAPPGVPSASSAPLPVQHVISAGLGRCAGAMQKMTDLALDAPYNAQSGWNIADPTHHVFQSVAGLKYDVGGASALAAMIASPQGAEGCDGTVVQIYPVTPPCDQVRASINGGHDIGTLKDVKVVVDAKNLRVFLVPEQNGGCVIVTVIAQFQQK